MHELGIVFHIQDTCREVAQQNELACVSAVHLKLGEVSGVVPSYLTNCWQWACKRDQLFTDCELKIEEVPALTFCEDCKTTYNTCEHGKTCPACGSQNTWLVQGQEVYIDQIEGS